VLLHVGPVDFAVRREWRDQRDENLTERIR
jgi:hypothetical protein